MTTTLTRITLLLALSLSLAACEAIGAIFRAGFWVGAIIVLLILALIGWFFSRGRRRP